MSRLANLSSSLIHGVLGLTVAATALLATPRTAQADTLVFVPPTSGSSGADLQDLDHHYMYTWLIQNINTKLPGGVASITGAKLKIDNIRNWNSDPNRLYLHMLNSVLTTTATSVSNNTTTLLKLADGTAGYASVASQVYRVQDDGTLSNNNVTLRDDLARDTDGTPDYTTSGRLMLSQSVLNGTGNTQIGNATGNLSIDNTGTSNDHQLAQSWAIGAGGDSTHSFTTTAQDYELDLTPYLTALRAYITSGNDLAIGFDPDCHFFNDGISLEIYTNTTTVLNGVPEPTSMVLLGSGLAALLYRRRRASKQTKA